MPSKIRMQGYLKGYRPPGRCSDTSICNGTANPSTEPYYAAHIMLLSHLVTAKEYRLTYQVSGRGEEERWRMIGYHRQWRLSFLTIFDKGLGSG